MTVTEKAARPELPSPNEAKAIRVNAGMTQAQLANEVGVHEITVSRWESGTEPRGLQRRAYSELLERLQRGPDS